ncbi:hypothetical protein PCCS19_25500 [Paenibacillus sp. CCS19]|nr:hypothetical protein PCCS19_25500 [Paenibacillus cellulosilyticus]
MLGAVCPFGAHLLFGGYKCVFEEISAALSSAYSLLEYLGHNYYFRRPHVILLPIMITLHGIGTRLSLIVNNSSSIAVLFVQLKR